MTAVTHRIVRRHRLGLGPGALLVGVVAHGVLLVNHGVLVTLGVLLRFGRAGGVFGMDAQAGDVRAWACTAAFGVAHTWVGSDSPAQW